MEIFGWITLVVFGLIGFVIVGYALVEFLVVQISIFNMKVSTEIAVMREDIKARGELKRVRLEKKRTAQDKIAHKKLDVQINIMKEHAAAKYDEEKAAAAEEVNPAPAEETEDEHTSIPM